MKDTEKKLGRFLSKNTDIANLFASLPIKQQMNIVESSKQISASEGFKNYFNKIKNDYT